MASAQTAEAELGTVEARAVVGIAQGVEQNPEDPVRSMLDPVQGTVVAFVPEA